jgi:hypothetical protein
MTNMKSDICLSAEEQVTLAVSKIILLDEKIKAPKPIATEFTKFPELPTELRLQIWRSTHFPGWTFRFQCGSDLPTTWDSQNINQVSGDNSIALQVNKESRTEALRFYSVLFECTTGPEIYFNPPIDRIVVYSVLLLLPVPARHKNPGHWIWKGEHAVRSVEIPLISSSRYTCSSHQQCPEFPNVGGIGIYFKGLAEHTIHPDYPYFAGHNPKHPMTLRIFYSYLEQQFRRGSDESKSDGYKIPKITIMEFPRKP